MMCMNKADKYLVIISKVSIVALMIAIILTFSLSLYKLTLNVLLLLASDLMCLYSWSKGETVSRKVTIINVVVLIVFIIISYLYFGTKTLVVMVATLVHQILNLF